jgi:glutamate carboxypeptidase
VKLTLDFERRRPPLELRPPSMALATHAQKIYAELGRPLAVATVSIGGGTDAAFAGLNAKGPVLERLGLRGFGSHSNNAEYIDIESIEQRLYLATRLIMDFAQGKDK